MPIMKKLRTTALAIAATGAASAALAAPALAVPLDPVNVSGAGGHAHFGTGCVAGGPPAGNGTLNWNEDLAAGTVDPQLTGQLCLQNTTATVQAVIISYDNSHVEINRVDSLDSTGNGGALNQFAVNLSGPVFNSAAMNHVHVQLQRQTPAGAWVDIPGATEILNYP
jgi:hypothetical protein